MADTEAQIAAMKQMFGDAYTPPSDATPAATEAEPVIETKTEPVTEPVKATIEPAVATQKQEPPAPAELTDEQILAFLKNKKGLDLKSLDDFAPKVDPVAEAEARENNKLKTAFEKGWISSKEYNSYVSDITNKQNVAFENYAKEAKEDDPTISDEQIAESFAEDFSLSADPDSFKYKQGQKKLNAIVDKIISEKHGKVLKVDSEFSKYESEIKQKEEYINKIITETPKYKQTVEDTILENSKFKVSLAEGEEYDVNLDDEDSKEIKKIFLSKDQAEKMIASGYSKEELQMSIKMAIRENNFNKILKQVTDQRLAKYAKGIQGVPVLEGLKDIKVAVKNLTDKEKAYAKHAGLLPSEN